MDKETKKYFQKKWHRNYRDLTHVDITSDCRAIAICQDNRKLSLISESGSEIWDKEIETQIVSLSMADTQEILLVDEQKYVSMLRQDSAVIWRKRPFPVKSARISSSGETCVIVTTDPAVICTNKHLRPNWAYRNLLRAPKVIEISPIGNTVAFSCVNENGTGLTALNSAGRPYDAFTAVEKVCAIGIDEKGEVLLSLDNRGNIFCVNIAKSFGLWKKSLETDLNKVSFASVSCDCIIYSSSGKIIYVDSNGQICWEFTFPSGLKYACLSSDGSKIIYTTLSNEIGMLSEVDKSALNSLEFLEVDAPQSSLRQHAFKRVWNFDISCSSLKALPWKGQDGVQYCVLQSNNSKISCVNDLGEEVWDYYLGGVKIKDMSVSQTCEMLIVLTDSGALLMNLSGNVICRTFGNFTGVEIFANGSYILIDESGAALFYESKNHYSHNVQLDAPVEKMVLFAHEIVIQTHDKLHIVNNSGETIKTIDYPSAVNHLSVCKESLCCADSTGKMFVYDSNIEIKFEYKFDSPIDMMSVNCDEIIISLQGSDEILLLKPLAGEMVRVCLTGNPICSLEHNLGMIVSTDLDQLGLIDAEGRILARYTSPYKITQLYHCHRKNSLLLLTEDSLLCLALTSSESKK